jgi:hypothetical protein
MRPPLGPAYDEARAALLAAVGDVIRQMPDGAQLIRVAALGAPFYAGRFEEALHGLRAD